MNALVVTKYNEIAMGTFAKPVVTEKDDVIVKVSATSFNPICKYRVAGYLASMIPEEFPFVLGYDVSGVVTAVGTEVKDFKVGDEVYGRPAGRSKDGRNGTMGEFCRVAAGSLALKPKKLTHQQAACVPLVGLTAFQCLEVGNCKENGYKKLFVEAGAGAVGGLAVQLGKAHFGIEHVAVTASAAKTDRAKGLGADVVVDYKKDKYDEKLGENSCDFGIHMGGEFPPLLKILKEGGGYVSVLSKKPEEKALAEAKLKVSKNMWMHPCGKTLKIIADYIDAGKVTAPAVDKTFQKAEGKEAFEYFISSGGKGKVIYCPN